MAKTKAKPKTELRARIPDWQKDCYYSCLNDLEGFVGVPPSCEYVAVDIETSGLLSCENSIVGISFSFEPGEAYYIPIGHNEGTYQNVSLEDAIAFLTEHFADKTLLFFNAKFELGFFRKAGFDPKKFLDVMILAYHVDLDITRMLGGLKQQSKRALNIEMLEIYEALGVSKLKRKQINFAETPVDNIILAYACADADITLRLFHYYKNRGALDPKFDKIRILDHRLLDTVLHMEGMGINVDIPYLFQLKNKAEKELLEIESKIHEDANYSFNIGAPQQLAKYFYNHLKLPVLKKTPTGKPSTDEETLNKLIEIYGIQYPVVNKIGQYRHLSKSLSTYIKPLMEGVNIHTGRMHPNYYSAKLITGRLSGTGDGVYLEKLNIQAIPKPSDDPYNIRKAFIPQEGFTWVSIDFSNIEIRVIANYCKDPSLVKMLLDGENQHVATMKLLFADKIPPGSKKGDPAWDNLYKIAKTLNFCVSYAFGINEFQHKLEIETGIKLTDDQCWAYFNMFFKKAYPYWGRWKERTRQGARVSKITSTTFGRSRSLKYDYDKFYEKNGQKVRSYGPGDRASVNHPIQGTAADLMRRSMVKVLDFLKEKNLLNDVHILSTIHDELNFEVRGQPGENRFDEIVMQIQTVMDWTPKGWVVPVKSEIVVGKNWGELISFKKPIDTTPQI